MSRGRVPQQHPWAAVDVVIFRVNAHALEALLVKIKHGPFRGRWAAARLRGDSRSAARSTNLPKAGAGGRAGPAAPAIPPRRASSCRSVRLSSAAAHSRANDLPMAIRASEDVADAEVHLTDG